MSKPSRVRKLLSSSAKVATLVVMGAAETACNLQVTPVDADYVPPTDAGPPDGGELDGGELDAGAMDAGAMDAGAEADGGDGDSGLGDGAVETDGAADLDASASDGG